MHCTANRKEEALTTLAPLSSISIPTSSTPTHRERLRTAPGRTENDPQRLIVQKMQQAGQPEAAIRAFVHYYAQLCAGEDRFLSGAQAQPTQPLPSAEELERYHTLGQNALKRTLILKLNGGLGTTMGMQGPKSLIQVKNSLTFLDIIVRQTLHLRKQYGVELPLVLMNSFITEHQTQLALNAYPNLRQRVPHSFVQHKVPKLWQENLLPVEWPADRAKEWCPPGHGDLYLALQTSGLLAQLLAQGYEYAFISNADNLGATLDLGLLGYFAHEQLPFLMEVARRQPMDCKGGHLAYQPGQGLILRELAQCPPDELDDFQDINRYCYFNTNNLWLHLPTLQQVLAERDGLLGLPLIGNEKAVDPMQSASPRVYQLETAMGHAIGLFPDAQAIETPRRRFLPVKNTNDLLALWSDAYILNRDFTITRNPARSAADDLVIDLDKTYYGFFHQLKARFPHHVPSLVNCRQLRVRGNVYFDADLALEGDVCIQQVGEKPVRWATVPLNDKAQSLEYA
jgi:UTP--glucose-1-phosphate uridylyltransferase